MKKILLILDMPIFLAIYCVMAVWTVLFLGISFFRKSKVFGSRRILELGHYGIEDIEKQGENHAIFKNNAGGYFDNTVTVVFSSSCPVRVDRKFTPSHRVISVPQQPYNFLNRLGLQKTNLILGAAVLIWECIKAARQENISIIRAQDPFILGYAGFMASAALGKPYTIHVIQNYDISTRRIQRLVFPPFLFKTAENAIERFIFKRALFVTSSYINYKFYALSHGADTGKTFSLRTPVNEIHFKKAEDRKDLKTELGLSGKKMLFYAGRLEKVKFVQDLILSFKEVSDKLDDAYLVLAGCGSLKNKLSDMAEERGIKEKILFLGKVSQSRLVDLYYSADVILFTHAGITLVEAALSGKPIACYDHDWAGEFAGYSERALLSNFRDYKALGRNALRLIEDAGLAASIGVRSRDFAMKYFNKEEISKIERSVFDMFLEAKNAGPAV